MGGLSGLPACVCQLINGGLCLIFKEPRCWGVTALSCQHVVDSQRLGPALASPPSLSPSLSLSLTRSVDLSIFLSSCFPLILHVRIVPPLLFYSLLLIALLSLQYVISTLTVIFSSIFFSIFYCSLSRVIFNSLELFLNETRVLFRM